MDYIYGKLDNNLVDINRIEYIQLKVCNLDNDPIEGLKSGQYYLETKIIDSDILIYTDLSALNKDDDNITSKLEKEIQDRISQGNILQTNINNEATRTDNMINRLNDNIKVIVNQLNENIASIVLTINTNLDNESKERLKQDTILDERITNEISNLSTTTSEQLTNLTNIVNQNKEDINNRVDEEVSNINNTISTTKQELQTNIDAVDKDLQDKYEYAQETITSTFSQVRQSIADEIERATQAETTLQSNIDKEIQDRKDAITTLSNQTTSSLSVLTDRIAAEETRASAEETNLDKEIKAEASERIQADNTLSTNLASEITRATSAEKTLSTNITNLQATVSNNLTTLSNAIEQEEQARSEADNDLSRRIDNLEGKTTRLYYGEGTLTSPTATEIQNFITNLEVDPPYTVPYSGIAVVVKLTDENTYHIWHYYANLSSWKDDGVDLVNTFTNDFKGIIQGTTSVGYISAENGFGKVNGWSELNTTISNNYSTLNTKIDNSVSAIDTTISTLSTRLDTKIDKEISDRQNAISSLSQTLTTSINNINITLSKAIADEVTRAKEAESTLSTNISSVSSNLNTFIDETAPNTYIKGSELVNQQIVLGAGGRNIKVSGKVIEEEQLSSSQFYVPTSQAVHNYVDPLFNNKVDKITTSNVVYVTTSTGTQSSIKYSTLSSGGTIVQRKDDGTIEAGNPSGDFDVVNLNYARSELNKKVSTITVSGNAEFVYSKNTNGNNTAILTSSNDGSDDASSKVTKYSVGGSLLVNLSDNLSEENKQRQATPKAYVDEIKTAIDGTISNINSTISSLQEQVSKIDIRYEDLGEI